MKPEELRIGNWIVNQFGDQQQLDIFNFSDFNWKLVKPIPLTEEWLERFGFENLGYAWTLGETGIIINITEWDDGEKYLAFEFGHNCCREIGYVHQLQNLYYALTGEELNIKQ